MIAPSLICGHLNPTTTEDVNAICAAIAADYETGLDRWKVAVSARRRSFVLAVQNLGFPLADIAARN